MARKKKTNGYIRRTFTFKGKRYQIYGHTAAEVTEKEAKKRAELEAGEENRKNPSMRAYYQTFIDARRHEVKDTTSYSQSVAFKIITETEIVKGQRFGDLKLQDITRRDVESLRSKLLESGTSAMYVNYLFGLLRHVFNSAVNDEIINRNPCRGLKRLKRDKKPANETIHRALTEKETDAFFSKAREMKSHYLNAFLIMIKTGLRVGELAALTFADIDIKTGFIHVKTTLTRNNAGGFEVGDSTKTESGTRDIPLTKELYDIFRKQRAFNAFIFGADKSTEDDLLFRAKEGGLILDNAINSEIKAICKAAGVEKFTCHAFRATFATRFIEQRPQDYKILAEILGHSKVSITLDLYTHVMTENKVEAMKDVEVKTG